MPQVLDFCYAAAERRAHRERRVVLARIAFRQRQHGQAAERMAQEVGAIRLTDLRDEQAAQLVGALHRRLQRVSVVGKAGGRHGVAGREPLIAQEVESILRGGYGNRGGRIDNAVDVHD